jgi:hypothetical protein
MVQAAFAKCLASARFQPVSEEMKSDLLAEFTTWLQVAGWFVMWKATHTVQEAPCREDGQALEKMAERLS